MVEKVAEVFTIIERMGQRIKKDFYFAALSLLLSCGQDPTDDPIPYTAFPDINIILSNYPVLLSDNSYIYIDDGGFRGLILYRKSATVFYAFERNCSFQPLDACATVEVHSSTLYMEDPCCKSIFNFEGNRTSGPAWRPLNQYVTIVNLNTVTITDTLID